MHIFLTHFCTICGREKAKPDWFLIAENRWEDKLKILEWNDRIAGMKGIHAVCGAVHAGELVIHWMKTGSLQYPVPRAQSLRDRPPQRIDGAGMKDPDLTEARQFGELYLHRESIGKILDENPESLTAIVDQLISALHPQRRACENAETSEISVRELQLVGD
jgi:hypothetical protein